uniref:Secreted protein n=1 Tax=Arundo donax TaxID=35708 RepID=A0A0A9HBF6_ARUDO
MAAVDSSSALLLGCSCLTTPCRCGCPLDVTRRRRRRPVKRDQTARGRMPPAVAPGHAPSLASLLAPSRSPPSARPPQHSAKLLAAAPHAAAQ